MHLKDCLKDPSKRERIRSLLDINPWWNLKILLMYVLWLGVAYWTINTPQLALRIVGYFVMGASIHSLAIFAHEATHGILFKNRFLNRWVGFFAGLPAFVSVTSYRVVHMEHHNHTGKDRDPDEFTNAVPNPALRRVAFFLWLVFGGPYYIFIHVPMMAWKLAKPTERRDMIVEYALITLIFATVITYLAQIGRMDVFLNGWAYPVLVAMIFVNVRGVAEHMMTEKTDEFTATRTMISNQMVSFFMNNLNYHLEHHLIPNVPWYRLQELHDVLEPDMKKAGSPVESSYAKMLLRAFRWGGKG
ncbi:MAG: fatty acid desaturase [Rhodothermales bacterium]